MSFLKRAAEPETPEATARRERYTHLAEIVRLGLRQFEKVGRALEEIRDHQLYRDRFDTFDDCCREEWNMSRQHAARLMAAVQVCRELSPTGAVPQTENQARQLASLPKEERVAAWQEALANGGDGAAVAHAVNRRRPPRSRSGRVATVRIRVPGATVVIEPNSRFTDPTTTLEAAIRKLAAETPRRAA